MYTYFERIFRHRVPLQEGLGVIGIIRVSEVKKKIKKGAKKVEIYVYLVDAGLVAYWMEVASKSRR